MATEKPRGGAPLRINMQGSSYLYFVGFETNSTSDPDGADPSQGVTVTRTGVGDYSITFDEQYKPATVEAGWVMFEENDALYAGKIHGYTASTGVVTMSVYGALGTDSAADWQTLGTTSTDTIVLTRAGYVPTVHVTAGGTTGATNMLSTGTPGTGEVTVTYTSGIATLTFAAADTVTTAAVLLVPTPAESDTNNQTIKVILLCNRSVLSTRA